MATAAPHVKLLRQLASAKDDYLSGAFDISWDGAKATLYLVFGRPSHAVFETEQMQIEGEAAIDALLAELPRAFVVSDWRRAMSPQETLSITIDELAGPFVRLAGSYADDPVSDESPEWWSAGDDSPDLAFGLADFPLLPGGRPLWTEASPEEVHLADRLAGLPPSILILTGAKLRAAAVVSGGDLIDAVWIDADDHARGETAGMAILGATKGSLAGYALDDPRVAEALTMLWRVPLAVSGVDLSWLDPASMLASFRADGLDRVLVIDAPVRGIALFSRGGLVAVYSETQRSAVASPERLRSLLSQARGRLTVMARKPRPLSAEAGQRPPSAHEFFETAATDQAPDAAGIAEPAAEAEPTIAGETVAAEAGPTEGGEPPEPASAGTSVDDLSPPPPPPSDGELPAGDGALPPPPSPDTAEVARKPKRSRWGFGRSRKARSEAGATSGESARTAENAAAPTPDADSSTFTGWSVRQPNPEAQPTWYRSHDSGENPDAATPVEPSPEEPATPAWSVVSPEASVPSEPAAPVESAAPADSEASAESTDDGDRRDAPSTETDSPPAGVHDSASLDEVHEDTPAGDEPEELAAPAPGQAFELVYADEPTDETATDAGTESWMSTTWLDDVVNAGESDESVGSNAMAETDASPDLPFPEDEPEPSTPAEDAPAVAPGTEAEVSSVGSETKAEPAAVAEEPGADHEVQRPAAVLRTPGPWSWPLAEADEPQDVVTRDEPAVSQEAEEAKGFFRRDEPVGSQFVDFDEVRNELVQIGVVWLGETNSRQVTALLNSTRSTIDDFVATIDTIRGLQVDGQDPASIQAMAREMHQQAAERLCGA